MNVWYTYSYSARYSKEIIHNSEGGKVKQNIPKLYVFFLWEGGGIIGAVRGVRGFKPPQSYSKYDENHIHSLNLKLLVFGLPTKIKIKQNNYLETIILINKFAINWRR